MKFLLSFLLGAIIGAAAALLFTPSSGEQLRANIRTQADTQYIKLQDTYQKSLQDLHARLDKMNEEL